MDKNITKRFKRKIFNRALSDANQSLDSKGERFKTWIRILLTIGIVAFSIPAFVWYREGSTQFFNFFISLLGADVFFLIGTFIYPYVIARANMWKYASILHQYMSGLDSPNIQITARKRNEGSNAWAYIHILNESYYPIEDCYVQIKAIEPSILSSVSGDVVLVTDLVSMRLWSVGSGTRREERFLTLQPRRYKNMVVLGKFKIIHCH
jgi:hypothetical protein